MKVLLALVVSVACAVGANAQGTIRGCVTDSLGAFIPGVDVVAAQGGIRERAVTHNVGCYEIRGLSAGRYTVTAGLAGFKSSTREDVRVVDGSPWR